GTTFSNTATVVGGTVGTAGKLSITGPLPDTASAVTDIDIGGLTPVTQYDQIAASGAATLAGTLNISLINSFVPAIGNSFTIMTFASKTGTFTTTNLPALPADRKWVVTYNTANVTLNVASSTVSWLSPVSGNWSDGSKWSGGVAPTSVDDVVINAVGNYTVTMDSNATVNRLNLGETSGLNTQTLSMNGKTLTIATASSVNARGSLTLAGSSTVSGPALLTNLGTMTVDNSTINTPLDNQGNLTLQHTTALNGALTQSGTMTIYSNGNGGPQTFVTIADGFTNNGTLQFTGFSSGYAYTNSLTVNGTGAILNAPGKSILSVAPPSGHSGTNTLQATLNNQGIFNADVRATFNLSKASAQHTNSGTFTTTTATNITQSGTSPSF